MAVASADIGNYESLRDWLTARPVGDALLIAFRSALRGLPFIVRIAPENDRFGDILAAVFWAHAVARVTGTWRTRAAKVRDASRRAAALAEDAASLANDVFYLAADTAALNSANAAAHVAALNAEVARIVAQT